MSDAFNQIPKLMADATMLIHPRDDALLGLITDASDAAVGAVLQQWYGGAWQPFAYFSKLLRKPELKYSAFDKEFLALYLATCHFQYFLKRHYFTAFTVHKPLHYLVD